MTSFADKLRLKVMGKQQTLMFFDTVQIFSREGKGIPEQLKPNLKKAQQSFRNHLIGGGALALALSLSLQRYFPRVFSTFSLNKLIIDSFLVLSGIGISTFMGLMSIKHDVTKIKRHLLMENQQKFQAHMENLFNRFQLSYRDQLINVLTREELQKWQETRKPFDQL